MKRVKTKEIVYYKYYQSHYIFVVYRLIRLSQNERRNWRLNKAYFPRRLFGRSTFNSRQRSYWYLLRRRFRLTYLRLLRLRDRPEVVAKGFAIGVFAGCFPLLGLQSLIGIFLATIFRASKVAAVAATWISNPLTYVPLFLFNYKIGQFLLRTEDAELLDATSLAAFRELGSTIAITLLTGSFIVGTILSIATYFYSLLILQRWRNRALCRRRLKKKTNNQNSR